VTEVRKGIGHSDCDTSNESICCVVGSCEKIVELEKRLNLLQVRVKRTLFDGFHIGITRKKTMKLGLDYVSEAYEFQEFMENVSLISISWDD